MFLPSDTIQGSSKENQFTKSQNESMRGTVIYPDEYIYIYNFIYIQYPPIDCIPHCLNGNVSFPFCITITILHFLLYIHPSLSATIIRHRHGTGNYTSSQT